MYQRDIAVAYRAGVPVTVAGVAPWWISRWHAEQAFLGIESLRFVGAVLVVAELREGLRVKGYAEAQNLTMEYRWAEGDYDRSPALAAIWFDAGWR
jgi:putative ABC transport system substrate-binding protein